MAVHRYLATCMVAKHRLFVWLPAESLPANVVIAFARSDDYFFGVLHSRIHEVWSLAQGTQLREKESGFRYTPTTCFETFPFPDADGAGVRGTGVPPVIHGRDAHATASDHGRDAHATASDHGRDAHATAISAAAKELNELRENWLNPPEWTRTEFLEFPGTVGGPWDRYIDPATVEDAPSRGSYGGTSRGGFKVGTVRYPRLVARDAECAARLKDRTLTKLYNERPAWLADCHARLDAAVAAAYGCSPISPTKPSSNACWR